MPERTTGVGGAGGQPHSPAVSETVKVPQHRPAGGEGTGSPSDIRDTFQESLFYYYPPNGKYSR